MTIFTLTTLKEGTVAVIFLFMMAITGCPPNTILILVIGDKIYSPRSV